MKKPVIVGIVFAIAMVVALIYTSFGNRRFHVEACMAYNGRTSCRKASAANREAALRSATDNACAQIASGVTETMGCTSSSPTSVHWLQ